MEYPLFTPPAYLANIGSTNWVKKQSKEYFDWFVSVQDQRVCSFLTFIDIKLTGNVEEDLNAISKKLYDTVDNPQYYSIREFDKAKILNDQGLAIAADMGLLLAQLLMEKRSSLYWEIAKGPKSYHSYNLPVLKKFKDGELDPIFDSIGNLGVSLNVKKQPFNWFERFDYLLINAI